MLLFICAREALRTFRRLDGPEPLVSGEFFNLPLGQSPAFKAGSLLKPAGDETSKLNF